MTKLLLCDISGADPDQYRALFALATEDRRRRAEICRDFRVGVGILAAQALLRLELPPGSVEAIRREPLGKPWVEGLHFNLSHSGAWVALALGDSPVGVDVQVWDRPRDLAPLLRRHFSAEEGAYIRGDPMRFLELWTRKESVLKRSGQGITVPLQGVPVLGREELRTWRLPDGAVSVCCQTLPQAPEFCSLARLLEGLREKYPDILTKKLNKR